MPLQKFATKDEVPVEFADTAIEAKDGSFYVFADEDVTALKSAVEQERERREAAEKLATKAANALKKAEMEAKAKASGLTDEQIAQVREEQRAALEAEYQPFKVEAEKAATLSQRITDLLLTDRIKGQMAAAGVRAERIEALFKLTGDRFALTADEKPMLKDNPALALDTYIRDTLKGEFPEFYAGTQAAGSGAPGSSGIRTIPNTGEQLTPEQRITAARLAGKAA